MQALSGIAINVEPIVVNDRLYFSGPAGRLWVSDGTAIGTGPIGGVPAGWFDALVGAGDSAFALIRAPLVRAEPAFSATSPTPFYNLRAVADRLVFTGGNVSNRLRVALDQRRKQRRARSAADGRSAAAARLCR